MADYYSNFSIVIPLSKKQCNWSEALYKAINHLNEGSDISGYPDDIVTKAKEIVHEEYIGGFLLENEGNGLWLQDDLNFMDDDLIAFIQAILIKFDLDTCVAVEVSANCSKPRLDAYGGYALFITKDNVESFSTHQWLYDIKLKREKEIKKECREILFRSFDLIKSQLKYPDSETFRCLECGGDKFEKDYVLNEIQARFGLINFDGSFTQQNYGKTYGDGNDEEALLPIECANCGREYQEERWK